MKDWYQVLGVDESATYQEIRVAYRKQSLVFHPDRGGETQDMQLINDAFKVLGDIEARDRYDEERRLFSDEEQVINEPDVLRSNDYLDGSGVLYSQSFKEEHAQCVCLFRNEPLEQGPSLPFIEKPELSIYSLEISGDQISKYSDIYSFLEAKSKRFSEQISNDEPTLKIFNPAIVVSVLMSFLKGEYFGKSLHKIIREFEFAMKIKQKTNISSSEYDLYEAIFCMIKVRKLSAEIVLDLFQAFLKITHYISQFYETAMPIFAPLLQSKYFRNLYSNILLLYWQSNFPSVLDNEGLKIFDGMQEAEELLENLREKISEQSDAQNREAIKRLAQVVRLLKQFEKDLDRNEYSSRTALNYREKAFHILDWIPAFAGKLNQKILVNIFHQAGAYLQRASRLERIPEVQMADEQLALKMYIISYSIGHHSTPDVQFYACFHGLKYLTLFKYLHAETEEVIKAFSHRSLILADIFPFAQQAKSNLHLLKERDQYIVIMRKLLHELVDMIGLKKANDNYNIELDHKYTVVLYQAYEACLRDWYEEHIEKRTQQRIRLFLMEELLIERNWTFDDIQKNLVVPWIMVDRTDAGWLNPSRSLPLPEDPIIQKISAVDGVEINYKTGEIKFFFKQYKDDMPPSDQTITVFDLLDMLSEEVSGAIFSLDPVDPDMFYHPFNQMRFAPLEVYRTPLFSTMLLTDYILKFLTVGSEVQGEPPYELGNLDQLIEHLPLHLQRIITDFHQSQASESLHRFWIEAVEIPVAMEGEDLFKDPVQRVALGNIKMVVKKHQMKRGTNGELVDQDESDEGWNIYILSRKEKINVEQAEKTINNRSIILVENTNEIYFYEKTGSISKPFFVKNYDEKLKRLHLRARDENGKIIHDQQTSEELYCVTKELTLQANIPHYFSPEYIFAKEFTLHYNEFAQYFPEFGRLRELSRITTLIRIMKGIFLSNQEMINRLEKKLDDQAFWQDMQSKIDLEIIRLRENYNSHYQNVTREIHQKISDLFSENRTKIQTLLQEKNQELSRMRSQIGHLGFTASSTEVGRACDRMYEEMKSKTIQQYGYSAWDRFSSEAWSTVQSRKSEIATQFTQEQRSQYKSQLTNVFSRLKSELSHYALDRLIEDFLNGNIANMAAELVKFDLSNLKKQIVNALENPSLSDVEQALSQNYSQALTRLTTHVVTKQMALVKSQVENEIQKVKSLIDNEKRDIRNKIAELKALEDRFVEIGIGRIKSPPDLENTCLWVPASFWHGRNNTTRLVYGGVNVQAQANLLQRNTVAHSATVQSAFYGNNRCTADRVQMLTAMGYQKHHIIPQALGNHELIQLSGINMDSRTNLISLPKDPSTHPKRSIHNGNHKNSYVQPIKRQMDDIVDRGKSNNWTQEQYKAETRDMIAALRPGLRSGDTALNKHHRPKPDLN